MTFIPAIANRTMRLSEAQNHRCPYCGGRMGDGAPELWPTREHLVPKAVGGTDDDANLVAVCTGCNQRRGDTPLAEFLGLDAQETAELEALLALIPRAPFNSRRVQGAPPRPVTPRARRIANLRRLRMPVPSTLTVETHRALDGRVEAARALVGQRKAETFGKAMAQIDAAEAGQTPGSKVSGAA